MKFTSSTHTWHRGISAVQSAVGSPISNPIVENIHLSCQDKKIHFMATNLNLTIHCEGEAEIEEEGEIVLPSKILINIVRDLPDGDVWFEEENETVRMKCGEFTAKLKGHPGELFPPLNLVKSGFDFKIDAQTLKDITRKTLIAASTDKARFELDGVKFDFKEKTLNCVSTDGKRLSLYKYNNETIPEEELSVFVPSKTLHEVHRTMQEEGEVEVRIQEKKIQFSCGDLTIISNLLVENFPKYEKIVPPPGDIKIKVKRELLLGAVKRASNLSDHLMNLLIMKTYSGHIELLGEREEVGGEGREIVDAEYEGEELVFRFNYLFILDFLRIIDEEEVEIESRNPEKPSIFRPVGREEFIYVLMPLRPSEQNE